MVSKKQESNAFQNFAKAVANNEMQEKEDNEKQSEYERHVVDAVTIGARQHVANVCGHSIRFRLLNVHEELQAQSLCKDIGEKAYSLAFAAAYFAMSCIDIDDEPFYVAISDDASEPMQRWKKAVHYYRQFILAWFSEYEKLLAAETEDIDKLGK